MVEVVILAWTIKCSFSENKWHKLGIRKKTKLVTIAYYDIMINVGGLKIKH